MGRVYGDGMVTLEQARRIARSHAAESWRPSHGTLHVDAEGFEDDYAYLVIVGARELLVDGDYDYLMLGGGVITVEKETGEVFVLDSLLDGGRIDAMTPTCWTD